MEFIWSIVVFILFFVHHTLHWIYILIKIWYVFEFSKCPNKIAGTKELNALAISRFDLPGDPNFPRDLNNLYAKPRSEAEMETMRAYLTQLRQELGLRLLDKVYADENVSPSKVWVFL